MGSSSPKHWYTNTLPMIMCTLRHWVAPTHAMVTRARTRTPATIRLNVREIKDTWMWIFTNKGLIKWQLFSGCSASKDEYTCQISKDSCASPKSLGPNSIPHNILIHQGLFYYTNDKSTWNKNYDVQDCVCWPLFFSKKEAGLPLLLMDHLSHLHKWWR